jgi:serine/threonine protein kinase
MQSSGKILLEKYKKKSVLGEGTYGIVYLAENIETGEVSSHTINTCLNGQRNDSGREDSILNCDTNF